ncbi:hypothetical protein M8J77_013587 [Diaphorina citri]|nr:hypothetical protein M8J77_013587 [Diaphorina citri]
MSFAKENEVQKLRSQLAYSSKNNTEVESLRTQIYECEAERKSMQETIEQMKKEQDDLLELMINLENTRDLYRNRLIQLGQQFDNYAANRERAARTFIIFHKFGHAFSTSLAMPRDELAGFRSEATEFS